jgi:hypothetical protein
MVKRAKGGDPAAAGGLRVLRLKIAAGRHAALVRAATDMNVSADQLGGVWLSERIDQFVHDEAVAGSADSPGSASPRRGANGSLHDEIVDVLSRNGGPMTAAEIAREIRQRGEYRAPRSGQPITGTAVSRRVANPVYKSLFERDGRRLTLADRPTSRR